jgi:hypothetical protein
VHHHLNSLGMALLSKSMRRDMTIIASMVASGTHNDSFKSTIRRVARSLSRTSKYWEIFLLVTSLWLSTWIMFKTFSYDYETNHILLSRKIWSDFAATLPLIRSFSFGENWPPEYPLFPGEPIRYHFLFYFLVGLLEKHGVPIHWALNLPSAFGFFAILVATYALSKRLFRDVRVAVLSVAFFLFNGSLSFLQFFVKHPLSPTTLRDILTTQEYTAMGPWDGGRVLGVWHLNVFINQRHFVIALGILMVFLFVCLWLENRGRTTHVAAAAIFGSIVGFFPLFHKPVLLMFAVAMSAFFVTLPYLRVFLALMGAISLSVVGILWAMSMNIVGPSDGSMAWHPGFTAHGVSLVELLSFLWYQFGLHCILVPLGLLLAPTRVRIFVLPALLVFAIGFTIQFSPEVLANHKFLNFALTMLQMLSAYTIFRAYDFMMSSSALRITRQSRRQWIAIPVVAVVILMATLSGIIDFVAIINDRPLAVSDVNSDRTVRWFYENTPKTAVVLNSSFLYHPASLAGRKIFLGWGYFTSTAGYPHDERMEIVKKIYAGGDPNLFCPLLRAHNISYVTVEDTAGNRDMPPINVKYFYENFEPLYRLNERPYAVFSTEGLCTQVVAR